MQAPEVMTPEDAAEYLRVHPQTVYRKLRAGEMPGAKIGDQWRIRRADLDEYLKGGRQSATTRGRAASSPKEGKGRSGKR